MRAIHLANRAHVYVYVTFHASCAELYEHRRHRRFGGRRHGRRREEGRRHIELRVSNVPFRVPPPSDLGSTQVAILPSR